MFGSAGLVYVLNSVGNFEIFVWAHHMYTVSLSVDIRAYFTATMIIIAVLTGIKMFIWMATMWEGSIVLKTLLCSAIGFIIWFKIEGPKGTILANSRLDTSLHDTYYEVAYFHCVLSMGAVFAGYAGFHYWVDKITDL